MNSSNVAIVGASDNPERYSYKATKLLQLKGYKAFPIHPKLKTIDGIAVKESLEAALNFTGELDTVTLYVNPQISSTMVKELIAVKPRRIIFNPGTENPEIYPAIKAAGIEVKEACTLVMLNTKQF